MSSSARGFVKKGKFGKYKDIIFAPTAFKFRKQRRTPISPQQFQPRLRSERAAQLFAWADAMRDTIRDHRPPVEKASVERDLGVIHSKLNDSEYASLYTEGRAMTIQQAIQYALEVENEIEDFSQG